jgi:hypothetical protein
VNGFKPQSDAAASPLIPGLFVRQGMAIEERLKGTFPPALFHFKILPPKITAKTWGELMQANQPFIGLGFNGFASKSENANLAGLVSWSVLTAVRMKGTTDKARYYGDSQGIGALTMAVVAAPLLHNFVAGTGTTYVRGVTNVAADDWGDDCVIMKIDLVAPMTLALPAVITPPDGLGWFGSQVNTWDWAAQDGSQGGYTSDWENTNEAC